MKAIATILSALALTGAVTAQSNLPACGTCISNLLNMASSFGCTSTDANCLCANADFTYGIRDCSNEACDDAAAASSVISYGVSYCASAGVAIPTTIATVTSGTIVPTVTSTPADASSATAGSSGSGSGSGSAVAVATTSYLTTLTSDGSTLTTSVVSTIFSSGAAGLSASASSVAASASSVASSASSGAASVASSASSVASSASSAASAAGSSASSAGSAAASSASSASSSASGTGSSSSSSALAPQMTAAPIGFLAAAGVAAMLL